MDAYTTLPRENPRLLDWLAKHAIEYEVHEHRHTFQAVDTATVERVDPRTFAKVVGVCTDDGRVAFIIVDAIDQVDLGKARRVLRARDVRLLSEPELTALAPDCETGAAPAVGALFGVPMYADYAIREDPEISFNAGSHRSSVRVERVAWERATGVVYRDLAVDDKDRTPWADA